LPATGRQKLVQFGMLFSIAKLNLS
jgi:hypothetical protein